MTVLIQGDEIRRVGRSDSVEVPPQAEVVDGVGRFLIPGLWDMHVHVGSHLGGPEVLPTFLAYGVTGVRDAGSPDSIATWASEIAAGTRVGPRILQAGPQIGAWAAYEELPQPHLDRVRSVDDAGRAIERRRGWADSHLVGGEEHRRDAYRHARRRGANVVRRATRIRLVSKCLVRRE